MIKDASVFLRRGRHGYKNAQKSFTKAFVIKPEEFEVAGPLAEIALINRDDEVFAETMKDLGKMSEHLEPSDRLVVLFLSALEPLSKKEIEESNIFTWAETEKILNTHFSGKKDFAYEIWALLCFQLWHKTFIQKSPPDQSR